MTDLFADGTLNFLLKRIVFVNSASHGYSEIMLDDHLALFGANNIGKTASLAGTKLMLYPETDFSHCDKKFKFAGKSGSYSKEDSYEFYFPSDRSFMAMEIENDIGVSCVVLYRAGNYRYYRVFLPLPYEQVRPLFWDMDSDDFAEDISVKKLLAFQRRHGGLHINEDRDLVELMYGNFARQDSRYCIVPLMDNNRNSIKAFRSIYQMAFDSGNGDNDALADAIATLVEMKRSRSQEKMNADLASLEEDYHKLIDKGEELQVLENNVEYYQHLKHRFEQLHQAFYAYSATHALLSTALDQQKANYSKKITRIQTQFNDAFQQHQQAKKQLNSSQERRNTLKGAIGQIQSNIDALTQSKTTAEKLLSHYQNTDVQAVLAQLIEEQNQLSAEQSALEDSERTHEHLQQLHRQINSDTERLESLKANQENSQHLLLNQVAKPVADVLISLNKDFGQLAVELNDAEQTTLTEFSQLFDGSDHLLCFKHQPMPTTPTQEFNAQQQQAQLQAQIDDLQTRIANHQQKVGDLTHAIKDSSGETRRLRLTKINQRLGELKPAITALKRFELIVEDIEEKSAQLKDKQLELSTLEQIISDQQQQATQAEQQLTTVSAQKRQIEERQEAFASFERGLASAQQFTPTQYISPENLEAFKRKLAGSDKHEANPDNDNRDADSHFDDTSSLDDVHHKSVIHNSAIDNSAIDAIELTLPQIDKLIANAHKIKEDSLALNTQLRTFTLAVPNEAVDSFAEINGIEQMGQIIQSYETSFSTLAYQRQTLDQRIAEHNSIISNQLKEIADAHSLLTDNIATINKDLNLHKISNLKQVRLKLHTHADFDHVYKLYQSYDVSSNRLMEREFYQSLTRYVDKHANKRTGLLRMRDIISKISFEYHKPDGTITDKSQSGGTTSTITASIIAILLGRIFLKDSSFKMPIIIDEIGDLDDNNTKSIIECIGEHGFSAFCATPEQRTSVCQNVGRWIYIDFNVLTAPQLPDCYLHIMPDSINEWHSQSKDVAGAQVDYIENMENIDNNSTKGDNSSEHGSVAELGSESHLDQSLDSEGSTGL